MPELKRVDFYNEPKKKKDTKEERKRYLIVGYIAIAIIAGIAVAAFILL